MKTPWLENQKGEHMICRYCGTETDRHDEACPDNPICSQPLDLWEVGHEDGLNGAIQQVGATETYILGYGRGEAERLKRLQHS
mgnify:CR=1 FL=1